MQAIRKMEHVIEAHDFDGTVANNIESKISAVLPRMMRGHEKLSKIALNVIFLFGDTMGVGKGVVEHEVMRSTPKLNTELVNMIRDHQREGADIFVLTSNGHSGIIEQIMLKNGINVRAVHCNPETKPDFIRNLIAKNPDKKVISVNDSPKEILHSFASGLSRNSIMFKGTHNTLPAMIFGALRIARVASEGEIDSEIRGAADLRYGKLGNNSIQHSL